MPIRSLIKQNKQVKSTENFKDLNYVDGTQGERELPGNIHDPLVAEETAFLEEDLNNLRAQIKDIIGKGKWYDEAGTSLEELKAKAIELETKIIEHTHYFHGVRDDDSVFEYTNGILTDMVIYKPNSSDILQESSFSFDVNGILTSIVKKIWDDSLNLYVIMQKDFIFDVNGNLIEIQNRII